jgi:hypothetical protein
VSRKRTGRRRGRPRKAHAKRRTTTRVGRRTGADPRDEGTNELQARKLLATTRPDLEASAIGVLYGRALIDARQYQTLSELTLALQRLARSCGGTGGVEGLWQGIIAAMTRKSYAPVPEADGGFSLADAARRQLARALSRLDGSRALVLALVGGQVPPLVIRALERRLSPEDEAALSKLHVGLDRIAGR